MDTWIVDYLRLCFHVDAALRQQGLEPFIDSYYGAAEIRQQALAETPLSLGDYLPAASSLLDRLPGEDFEPGRAAYLEKQTRALETIIRIFSGEQMSLEERLRGCLDVEPQPKPETDLDRAFILFEQALPGKGDLRQRYAEWQKRNVLPPEKVSLAEGLMRQMLAEVRRRTQELIPLPPGDELDLQVVRDKPYGAANWYLGGYRSRLELNVSRPIDLSGMLYQMSHEGYPGHHCEYSLKEAHLYRERGFLEMGIYILSPQLVISEGIATLSLEMIFSPEEAAHWVKEHIYGPLGIPVEDVDLEALYRARDLAGGDELGGNVVLMMEAGASEEQMVEYILSRTLYPEQLVREWMRGIRDPLQQIYAFSYYQGARLMRPLLRGEGRAAVFRRFLTEQVYPSMLESGTF